jgi:Flp pilus assembly protein TadG
MPVRAFAARFARAEDGGITFFALFLFLTCLVLGGLAVDVARTQTAITRLQNVADAAAHAAVYSRSRMSEAQARALAVDVAMRNLPPQWNGPVVTTADIEFGEWDPVSGSFQPRAGATEAVRVTGHLGAAQNNPFRNLLLGFAGFDQWDIEQTSTMRVADHDCLTEGLVSETSVEIGDANQFGPGFCIHSNAKLKIGVGNIFATNAVVSMPAPDDIYFPSGGFTANAGLQTVLRPDRHKLRALGQINAIISGLMTPGSEFIPDYITNHEVITHASRTVRATSVTPGRIHWVSCTSTQRLTIATAAVLRNIVIVTNCRTDIYAGAVLENVVLATTDLSTTSISAANGMRLGLNDNCAAGGGAQLLTLGGMRFSTGLEVFGGQLLAAKGILFTSSPGQVKGASFMAGAEIRATNGLTFEACGGAGMEDNFVFPSTQLVN